MAQKKRLKAQEDRYLNGTTLEMLSHPLTFIFIEGSEMHRQIGRVMSSSW